MRRGLLIGLLATGTVLGFGFAFSRHCAYHHGYGGWQGHRHGPQALEDRAADACVRATERVLKERAGAAPVKPKDEAAAPPAATP